jgi:hypothetical protein
MGPDENLSDASERPKKRPNDLVRKVKDWAQVEKLYIDIESPTFKKALTNLGLEGRDCKRKNIKHFEEKGVD